VELVGVEDRGAVRHLVLTRPEKRNALSLALYRELRDAAQVAAEDPAVRVVVVRGEGPAFSAGNDVTELAALPADPGSVRRHRPVMLGAFNLLEEMPKPTIAQVHGLCIGAAFELALACDLRVFADDAMAGLLETKLGLVPDLGGCSRLPAVVGLGRAKELVMTARLLDAAEAERIGLANRIAPRAELDAAVQGLCDELMVNAPRAVGLAKRVLDAAAKPGLAASLELEVTAQELLARTEDLAEGTRAVAEKRTPRFVGR
jgi:enoyl-CoA hydratase/carnithine racemase